MDAIKSQILAYTPYNEREASDKALFLQCLETFSDLLSRNNPICHFTASNWIVNQDRTKALLIFHNIEQMWMWTGGHADGECDLLNVALREAHEETGLKNIHPLNQHFASLEVFAVPPHIRKGKFISSHLHLNCGFLLEADETEVPKIKPDENSAIEWMTLEDITKAINAGTMGEHYLKLIEKAKLIK